MNFWPATEQVWVQPFQFSCVDLVGGRGGEVNSNYSICDTNNNDNDDGMVIKINHARRRLVGGARGLKTEWCEILYVWQFSGVGRTVSLHCFFLDLCCDCVHCVVDTGLRNPGRMCLSSRNSCWSDSATRTPGPSSW